MKKGQIIFLSVLFIVILFIGGYLLMKDNNNEKSVELNEESKEESTAELLEEQSEAKTITHENGDYIYIPAVEDIGYDSEEKTIFYEKLLNLYLNSKITDEQAGELANSVNGKVVGRIQGSVNVLQLQVEEETLEELSQLANSFEDAELVAFADVSTPAFISDLSGTEGQNDSQNDSDEGNWWIEAINASAAWDYLDANEDKFEDKFKPVKVAVLETGKLGKKGYDIDHEDIQDSVEVLDVNKDAEDSDHATLVTRIIAAKKDSERFRGVATGIADVKFTSIGGSPLDEVEITDKDGTVLPEIQIILTIKANIENGKTVINNSWGLPPFSETKWNQNNNKWFKSDEEKESLKSTYGEYLIAAEIANDKISAQLIYSLDQMLKDKNDKFLIVQSAGNGFSKTKKEKLSSDLAIKTEFTGSFANINKTTHTQAQKLNPDNKLKELDEILDHIIVVGGATKRGGNYYSPEWASYGNAIDIAAPAENLYSDEYKPNGTSGTSFSAPMVTGAVALIWSYNPGLTAPQVKEILLNSAEEHVNEEAENWDKITYPMLNLVAFLRTSSQHYNTLIENYQAAIEEEWSPTKLAELNMISPFDFQEETFHPGFGYELRDINKDGIQELILGVNREDGRTWIQEIYTLVNDTPVKVFKGGLHHSAVIYKDGTIGESQVIVLEESISEQLFYDIYINDLSEYELGENAPKKLKEGYQENSTKGTFKNLLDSAELMEKPEADNLLKKYEGIGVYEHLFTPFQIEKETK